MKRIWMAAVAVALCCVMMLPFFGTTADAATSSSGKFTNEVSRTTKEIALPNGTKTGVMWTQAKINGPYYGNKDLIVNIAEFDLANTNLSVEVLNHGEYLVNRSTSMKAEIEKYNAAHPGQTILAAVNGDLFMTSSHSNSNVTKKVLAVSRGIQIIDGEIWATQQTTQENIAATGFDAGKPVDEKNAFGVTDTNQPIVGAPMFTVTMTVNGRSITTDGLNRLPATDSITVYNHRVNSSNYALNDAYEIELEAVGSPAFTLNSTVTAKVKAIYPAGSTTRPAIGSNTILVTARGSRVGNVQGKFAVGNTVTFTTTVTDSWNNASMWKNVEDAIGGYIAVVKDNQPVVWNTTTSGYPSSFIGIKDDGSVGFVTVTRATNEAYGALNRNQAYAFCMEYGYNRVFHLDGGGSCTFYSLENGTYTRRTTGSDSGGAERTVINSVAVVWNDTPVCSAQGSMSHIKGQMDLANTSPTYLDGKTVGALFATNNQIWAPDSGYDASMKAFMLTNPGFSASDAYVYLNYSLMKRVNAQDYRYVVLRVITTYGEASNLSLFYNCGSETAASSSRVKTVQIQGWNTCPDWQYVVFDMQGAPGWTGQLNNVRIDLYDGLSYSSQMAMYIQSVSLCKDMSEVNDVKNGGQPGVCAHTYSTVTTKKATCTETGIKTSTCSKCGDVKTSTTKALGHRYTTTNEPATCTEPAKTVKACNRTGCTHKEETTTGTALGHDYKTTTTKATCTKDGKTVTTCSRCDYSKTETIKKLGHDTKTTTTKATCTADGKTVTTCSRCDYSKTEVIKATGHDTETATTPATCTEDGQKVTTCKKCDYSKTETIKATGHSYANGVCSVCGAVDPATTVPDTTIPDTTEPETTVPDTTVPDTTVPETTVPETTIPDTTVDGTEAPDTTVSETEDVVTTEPIATEPSDATEGDDTVADETTEALATEGKETEPAEEKAPARTAAIVLIAFGAVGVIAVLALLLADRKKKK